MSTTTILVEILIIGVQSGITILLWAIGLLGYGVLHKPLSLLDVHGGSWRWLPLLGIAFAAACYTLGILVDRIVMVLFFRMRLLCPDLFKWLEVLVKKPCEKDEPFIRVLSDERQLSTFLQDYRSRLRIARATVFNLFFISIGFLVTPHLLALLPRSRMSLIFIEISGLILVIGAFLGWAILQITYDERMQQVEKIRSGKR